MRILPAAEGIFRPRRFHVEHIVPKQHSGSDDAENLALACEWRNLHKGPNLAGIDEMTGTSPCSSTPGKIAGRITSNYVAA